MQPRHGWGAWTKCKQVKARARSCSYTRISNTPRINCCWHEREMLFCTEIKTCRMLEDPCADQIRCRVVAEQKHMSSSHDGEVTVL